MTSTISAVIPCYNAAPYLAQAIESVQRQTRPVHEIVVADDCSTDDSAAIARRYGVRYVRLDVNSGNAAARNRAMREATGDLLAWLDADDFWEPEHCEIVGGLLDRFPEAAVAFGGVRFVGALPATMVSRFPPDQPVDAFWVAFHKTAGPQSAAIVRRDALLAVGGYNEAQRVANDYEVWTRLARRYPFVATHRITASYRQHDAQLSRRPDRQYRATYEVRHRLLEHARREGDPLAAQMEERMRAIWVDDLESCWRDRDMALLDVFYRCGDLVPGAPVAVRRRFGWRRRVPRAALRALDLGPAGLARKLWYRAAGQAEPRAPQAY